MEEAKKNEQKRLCKKGSNIPLSTIKHENSYLSFNTNINIEDQKNKSIDIDKRLDHLHKEIKVTEIFDKFKNIVNFNADISKKSELEILRNSNDHKELFGKLKDTSLLHRGKNGYLPKIKSYSKSLIKSGSGEYNPVFWSPIDMKKNTNSKEKSYKKIKLDKLRSIKNRPINFKKHESIFLTNNYNDNTNSNIYYPTREKTINNSDQKNTDYFNLNSINNINTISNNGINVSNLMDKSIISVDKNSNQSLNYSIFD